MSPLFLLRYALAATLFHPLEGVLFGDWLRLLRREGFRVAPWRWPRAAWVTAWSLGNSLAARRVAREFGAAIEATEVKAPVFVLGHYRGGTTYLHELLMLDPRFASPTRFRAYNPSTFLATERWLAPLIEPLMLPRRVQEDEIALMVRTGLSPYMEWVFPRTKVGHRRDLRLRGPGAGGLSEWSAALTAFLKALTLRDGRTLVLKSPPHTARIGAILRAFPDARFVHIRRDPYAVYVSTVGLLRAVPPVFRLGFGPRAVDSGAVLDGYVEMYDAYFEERDLIPPGRLVEIAYEDLERDPVGQVRAVYEGLALGEFEGARPALEAYLGTIAGYRKNRHPALDSETRLRVAGRWSRCFDAWGYPR